MMLAFGAAASAIDSLFGLVSPKQTQSAGSGRDQSNLFAFQADAATSIGPGAAPAAGGGAQISPETMTALLTLQGQSGSTLQMTRREDGLKELIARMDADGDGKITKGEFEKGLGPGVTNPEGEDLFGTLDKDGDGSVSAGELASALLTSRRDDRDDDTADGADSNDPLQPGGNADGSSVTMMGPAASSVSTSAISSYSFLDQLIRRQANAVAARTSSSVSVSV